MRIQLNQQVSFFVVILIALSVLVAIRFSGFILPSKYYFSISSVFKSDESLMLVSHPGVTGQRFCELMRQHKVTVEDIGIQQFDCSADKAPENFNLNQHQLKATDRDKIYDVWINSKDQIAFDIQNSINRNALTQQIIEEISTINVYEKEKIRFGGVFSERLDNVISFATRQAVIEQISPYFQEVLGDLNAKFNQPVENAPQFGETSLVSEEDFMKLRAQVALAVGARITQTLGQDKPVELEFSDMRSAVEGAQYSWSLESAIIGAYSDKLVGPYQPEVDRLLAEQNLRAADIDKAVASVQKAFLLENLPIYTVSAIIRFTVVFITVFLIAFATFGKLKIQNYSFGAAMAAILLTWPVLSLWDWVVREEWQALKFTFLAIYLLYAIAFFFTGKAAGQCAFVLRNRLANSGFGQPIEAAADGSHVVFQTSLKEMLNSCMVAGATSAFVYALNIIVPVNV